MRRIEPARVAGFTLVLAVILAPSLAAAAPVVEGTRIGVQAGWRYAPNARFGELAEASGHPLSGPSSGGPSVLGVFAYRPRLDVEIAIEVGYAHEGFNFRDGTTLSLEHVPLAFAARWSPKIGRLTPYLGGGMGYFLNFFSGGPVGGLESHAAGPFVLAGASWEVSSSLAILGEYRLAMARAQVPGLGALQTGGNWLSLGVQLSFPPGKSGIR